jgi:alpha-L-fucosidase 2
MKLLEEKGTSLWVGYSFSWQANLYARMMKGDAAAKALRSFATCFCLPNGFHVNGDQCTGQLSSFRYRPFTLEGNFAFAAATQEMLLQSHDGIIQVFPAVPSTWSDASFEKLRAEGAFIISAVRENGKTREVRITSEKGGVLVIQNPFDKVAVEGAIFRIENNLITITTSAGQHITLKSK